MTSAKWRINHNFRCDCSKCQHFPCHHSYFSACAGSTLTALNAGYRVAQKHNRLPFRRIFQPLFLGSVANIIVNYVFDPESPDFFLSEFIVAILLSIPITEFNYHIDKRLERRFSWTRSFSKRFFYHLGLLTLSVLFVLNVIGNIYVWITHDGFYTLNEMIIINAVLFVVLLLITFFNWAISFYKGWKKTESHLEHSKIEIRKLSSHLNEEAQQINFEQGKKKVSIPAKEVLMAKSEHGIVRVWITEGNVLYSGSLQNLLKKLPKHRFFLIARNVIVQKEMIKSITSSTYGKVIVEIKDTNEQITVSRQKAASFRKWYNSTSSQNS